MATVDVVDALPVASEEAQPSVVQILSKEPVVEDAEMKSTIVTNGDSTHELELPTEGEEVVMDSKPDADPVLSSGLEDNNAIPADRSTFVEVEQSTSGDAKEGGTDPQKVDADATGAPDSAVDDNLDIVLEKKDVEEGQAVEVQGEEFPETTQVIDKSIIVQEGPIDVAVQDINDAEQTSDISTNSETPSVAVTGHNSKSHHSEHSSLDIDHTSVQSGSLQEEVADSTAEKPAKNLVAQDVDDMIDAQSTAEIIPTPAVAESIEKGTDLASAAEQYPVTQTDINDTVPVESSVATDSQASVEESIEMPADKLTGEPVDTNDHFPTEVAEPPVSPESSVSAKDEADGISIAGNDNVPTELEVAQPAAPVEAEELVSQSEPLAEPIKKVISAPVESSNLEPEAVKEGVPTAEVVENTTSDEGVPTEETALPQSRVSDDVVSTADLQTSLDDNVASSASQASASELQQVEDVPAVSETENIVPVEEDANIAAAQGVASHNEDLLTPAQDSALVEDVLRHSEVEELINAAPETEIEPVAEPPSQAVVDENAMEDKPIASAVSVEGIDNDAIDAIVENLTSSLPDSEPVDPELKTDQNAESSETPIADSVDAAVQESVPDILVVVSEPETQTHSKQFAEGNASALVEEISESSVIPESQVFSAEAIETAGATQADELVSGHEPAATESGLDSGSDVPEEAAAEDVSAQVEEITPVEDTISETPSIVEPPASESESAVPAIYAEIGESESTTHSFEAPAEVQPVPEVELVIDQSEPPVVTTQLQEADVELVEPTQNEEFIPETEISVSTDSEALLEDGIEDQLRVEEASTHVEKAAKPLVDEQVEANVSKEAEEEFVPSSVPSEPQASEIPLTETEFVGESAPVMSITESQTSIDVSVEDTTADKLPEPTVPSNESKLNDTQAIPAESAPITIESSAGEEEMKPLITPIIVTEDSQDIQPDVQDSVHASDVERPISPSWTQSYSVLSQGPGTNGVEEQSDEVKDEPQLTESIAATETQTTSRPVSPWTPSYSVSRQGSPLPETRTLADDMVPDSFETTETSKVDELVVAAATADEQAPIETDTTAMESVEPVNATQAAKEESEQSLNNADESHVTNITERDTTQDEMASSIAINNSSDLDVEDAIERPKSPWTPSYSVTSQGPGVVSEEEIPLIAPLPSATEVNIAPITVEPAIEESAPTNEEKSAENETRSASPWTPSHSTSVQDGLELDTVDISEETQEAPVNQDDPAPHTEVEEESSSGVARSVDNIATQDLVTQAGEDIIPEAPANEDRNTVEVIASSIGQDQEVQTLSDMPDVQSHEEQVSVPDVQIVPEVEGQPVSAEDVLSRADVVERPKSPWMPSYSVTQQGNTETQTGPSEQGEDDSYEPPQNAVETSSTLETKGIEAPLERPWTPSYSVYSISGAKANDKGFEDQEAAHDKGTSQDLAAETVVESQPTVESHVENVPSTDENKQLFPTSQDNGSQESLTSLDTVEPKDSKSRARLESTTSSLFFPGGWFSRPPPAALDTAQGQGIFTPSKPNSPTEVPESSTSTSKANSEPIAEEAAEVEAAEEKKSRWCVVM